VDETENGGSRVEVTVQRVGKSLKGRILALVLHLVGRRIFTADVRQALDRIARANSVPADERAPAHQSEGLPK
jgi:hypothetical protein